MEERTGIRVAISDHFQLDGVAVTIGTKVDANTIQVMHFTEDGYSILQLAGLMEEIQPSLRLPHEYARALLDALLRYYQGASDLQTLRQDYLHERDRVDKMLDSLIILAGTGRQ